jgi:hypothetical protein
MKCYKLTDSDGYTRRGETNETLWGEGVTHTAAGRGGLCTDGVIHAYASHELALFMNPNHANIADPMAWECEGVELVEDDGTKQGYKTLTTLIRVEEIRPTTEQRVRFAILCGKAVYKGANWNAWADNWLDGSDRTADTATCAAHAATCAADAATDGAATCATCAATCAAYAAACAAYDGAATCAADAAYAAAYAYAACAAVDLSEIAKEAMEATK